MIASLSVLSRSDLQRLPRELTCFLIPVGGLEDHGDHLPLGTRLLQAEAWAEALAKKLEAALPAWSFVILPSLPLTVDSVTSELALHVRAHVVRDAIVDQCEQLKRAGFLNFAVVSGHLTPKQLTAIEDAARIVSRGRWFGLGHKAQIISVSSALVTSSDAFASPMIAIPAEHGGALDTAMVLGLNPEWVKPEYKTLPPVERPRATVRRFVDYFQGKVRGYWGNPAAADPAFFLADLDRKNTTLVESIRVVLESGRGTGAFRSHYRFYPLNGSFFKAYVLATLFFILMLLWVISSLKGIFEP